MDLYDTNRRQLCNREMITALYGEAVGRMSLCRLGELGIYPLGPEPEVPRWVVVSALQTPEEEANGGPIYDIRDGQAIRRVSFERSVPVQLPAADDSVVPQIAVP